MRDLIQDRIRITPLNLRAVAPREAQAFTDLINVLRAERLPDDPPIPLEENVRRWAAIPSFVDVFEWVAWHPDQERLIGFGELEVLRTDENKHVCEFTVFVAPEFRRQGVGRQLLSEVVAQAEREARTLLVTGTDDRAPEGQVLMTRLGASKAMEEHVNQLRTAEVNHGLLEQWLSPGPETAAAFQLLFWEDGYPEEHIEAFCKLFDVMNSAPRGTLQLEDFHFTVDRLRDMVRQRQARGAEGWTLVARERTTGRLAGFTEVFWNPNRPEILDQAGTGVLEEFRNRGLGRWLKATMLDKVLRERPQVKFVRTGNADTNAAMLRINHQLGFKPYIAGAMWQVETARVRDYVSAHPEQLQAPV